MKAFNGNVFIISLHYIVPLEEIDAMIPRHVEYLDKHYASGNFLVSGRKVPRTGGVIMCLAKDLAEVEEIIKQDPFWQYKLATIEITEFTPGKSNPDWWPNLK